MTNEEVMKIMFDMGLHDGGMENWIPDNAWVRVVNKAVERMQEEIDELRKALAQQEQEAFKLDRGCWERGCMAYDTRDCDEGVTVYVDNVYMSEERVHKTEKSIHEPEEKNHANNT